MDEEEGRGGESERERVGERDGGGGGEDGGSEPMREVRNYICVSGIAGGGKRQGCKMAKRAVAVAFVVG